MVNIKCRCSFFNISYDIIRESRVEKQAAESKQQRAGSRKQRADSRQQAAESREQAAGSREQATESRQQRAYNREQRAVRNKHNLCWRQFYSPLLLSRQIRKLQFLLHKNVFEFPNNFSYPYIIY